MNTEGAFTFSSPSKARPHSMKSLPPQAAHNHSDYKPFFCRSSESSLGGAKSASSFRSHVAETLQMSESHPQASIKDPWFAQPAVVDWFGSECHDEEEKHANPSTEVQTGVFGTFANLTNSILGPGIVGMPYAMNMSGFATGMICLSVAAALADKSLRMIVDLASFHPSLKHRDVITYENLASYPFRKLGEGFILYSTFVMAYGAMVSYLIIIKDTLPTVLGIGYSQGFDDWTRELVLTVTAVGVILPLSLQKDIASLSFASVLSIISVIYLLIFVIAEAPFGETVTNAGGIIAVITSEMIKPTCLISIGIFADSFACQHAAFVLSGSLRRLNRRRWAKVTNSSMATVFGFFSVMGVVGFLGFLEDTRSDIINNFLTGGIFGNIARSLLALTMCTAYPIECFVCRHVLSVIIYREEIENTTYLPIDNQKQRIFMTLLVFFLTMIPAMLLSDLGIVLSLTGSLGATSIAYIAPGLIFLGVNGDAFLRLATESFASVVSVRKQMSNKYDIELPMGGQHQSKQITARQTKKRKLESSDKVVITNSQKKINDASATVPSCSYGRLWVWYMTGMPIWCRIAAVGQEGMKENLKEVHQSQYYNMHMQNSEEEPESAALSCPEWKEFRVAIAFIVFGVVAAVAGLGFQIYNEVWKYHQRHTYVSGNGLPNYGEMTEDGP